MANTLQTSLKKKTQQESELLYVPAQTGQKGTGSLVINSSASQPAYGYPVSNQQGSAAGNQNLAAQASPAQASAAGPNINGVSDWSKQGLVQYGRQYAPSQAVAEAQDYLQSVMDGRPGSFSSKYAGDIAALYDQIMNRPKFEYDVNRDPLFQQYKNQYTVQGQRAMQDTLGQAAGLTGGYGNSWGTTAGYQAYQYYLQQLNDRIPEMEQRAFDRYTAEGDEMRANMNMATTLDNIDYNRYRDTVADWQADRNFAANMYAQERTWDMDEWNSMRSYYTQLAGLENGDYWNGRNLDENARQFDLSLAEQQRQADQSDAFKYAQLAENARQYDTSFAENQRQYNTDAAYRQAEADRAADQWLKQYEENIRQYNQNFGENQRQFDIDAAYRQAEADRAAKQWQTQFNENVRQADLDEAYRRDTLSEEQRQADLLEAYRQAQLAENARQYDTSMAENVRQADLDEAYRRDTMAENIRQYEQNFAEDQRQADLLEAYRQAQLAENARQYDTSMAENVRQADLDEAYRRDTMAENIRQYEQNFAEDQRQADLLEAYRQAQLAENIRQYDQNYAENVRQADLDEAYRQAQLTENIRQYNQNFGEDQRQYDTSLAEKIREFDLAQALDQAEFDLKYQKYLDELEKLNGSGKGGNNNGGNDKKADTTPEEKANSNATTKEATSMQELMVNYAQNKVGVNENTLTNTLKKDLDSQKGDMVTLPIATVNAAGTLNQGPLAERTQAMPREQAEKIISELEDLNKKNKTTTTKKSTAKTSLATQTNKTNQLNEWLNTTKKK